MNNWLHSIQQIYNKSELIILRHRFFIFEFQKEKLVFFKIGFLGQNYIIEANDTAQSWLMDIHSIWSPSFIIYFDYVNASIWFDWNFIRLPTKKCATWLWVAIDTIDMVLCSQYCIDLKIISQYWQVQGPQYLSKLIGCESDFNAQPNHSIVHCCTMKTLQSEQWVLYRAWQ